MRPSKPRTWTRAMALPLLLSMLCSGCATPGEARRPGRPTSQPARAQNKRTEPPKHRPIRGTEPEDDQLGCLVLETLAALMIYGGSELLAGQMRSPQVPWPVATGAFSTMVVPAHDAGTLGVMELRSGKLLWCSAVQAGPAQPLGEIIPAQEARRNGLKAGTVCKVYLSVERRQERETTAPTTMPATTQPD